MHILMLSLIVAFAVCALLLVAIGLFAMTRVGRRIGPTSVRTSDPHHIS